MVPHDRLEPAGEGLEHLVSEERALVLTHGVETLDVDHEAADRRAVTLAAAPLPGEPLDDLHAIPDTGHRIDEGHLGELELDLVEDASLLAQLGLGATEGLLAGDRTRARPTEPGHHAPVQGEEAVLDDDRVDAAASVIDLDQHLVTTRRPHQATEHLVMGFRCDEVHEVHALLGPGDEAHEGRVGRLHAAIRLQDHNEIPRIAED